MAPSTSPKHHRDTTLGALTVACGPQHCKLVGAAARGAGGAQLLGGDQEHAVGRAWARHQGMGIVGSCDVVGSAQLQLLSPRMCSSCALVLSINQSINYTLFPTR